MTEESLEVRIARLEERDASQWNTLKEIKEGNHRIEGKLDDLQAWKNRMTGKMIVLGSALFVVATAVASWVVTAVTAHPAS